MDFQFGAIRESNGEYVLPKNASKDDSYKCPSCRKDVVFCKGDFRIPYFRHKHVPTDKDPCTSYTDRPSESVKHKEAKQKVKYILNNYETTIYRNYSCHSKTNRLIDLEKKQYKVELEYQFDYKDHKRYADVAVIDDEDRIIALFEVCHTSKTSNEVRPEPWFEFKVDDILKINFDIDRTDVKLLCSRSIQCKKCKGLDKLKKTNLEKYIRLKLGQRFKNQTLIDAKFILGSQVYSSLEMYFKHSITKNKSYIIDVEKCMKDYELLKKGDFTVRETPLPYFELLSKIKRIDVKFVCGQDKDKFSDYYVVLKKIPVTWYSQVKRLRFEYDARSNNNKRVEMDMKNNHNKKICELFTKDLNGYVLTFLSYKGSAYVYLITAYNYKRYNYYTHNDGINDKDLRLPYTFTKDMTCDGTVKIIKEMIEKANSLPYPNDCDYSSKINNSIDIREFFHLNQ